MGLTRVPSNLSTRGPTQLPCLKNPCQNGGTCFVTYQSSSDDVDQHRPNATQVGLNNGGGGGIGVGNERFLTITGYSCICALSWGGKNCHFWQGAAPIGTQSLSNVSTITSTASTHIADVVPILLVSFNGDFNDLVENDEAELFKEQVLTSVVSRYDASLLESLSASIHLVPAAAGTLHARIIFDDGSLDEQAVESIAETLDLVPIVVMAARQTYMSRSALVMFESRKNIYIGDSGGNRVTIRPPGVNIDLATEKSETSEAGPFAKLGTEAIFGIFGLLLILVLLCAMVEFKRQNTSLGKNTQLIEKLAALDDLVTDVQTSHADGRVSQFEEDHWMRLGMGSPLRPGTNWRPPTSWHPPGTSPGSTVYGSSTSPWPPGMGPRIWPPGWGPGMSPRGSRWGSPTNSQVDPTSTGLKRYSKSENANFNSKHSTPILKGTPMYLPGTGMPGVGVDDDSLDNLEEEDMFAPANTHSFDPPSRKLSEVSRLRANALSQGSAASLSASSFANDHDAFVDWSTAMANRDVLDQDKYTRGPNWERLASVDMELFERLNSSHLTEEEEEEQMYDMMLMFEEMKKQGEGIIKLTGVGPDDSDVSTDIANVKQPVRGFDLVSPESEVDYDFADQLLKSPSSVYSEDVYQLANDIKGHDI